MGFDGRMTQRRSRTLSTREAIELYGDGWECADNGLDVRQRLKLLVDPEAAASLIASEELAVHRAVRLLRRERLTAQVFVEQLEMQAQSIASIPFSRLIAGRRAREVRAQVVAEKARIAALPTQPNVHRLDPEADTGLPADAKKVGTSIWFLDKATMTLASREIRSAGIELLDNRRTLVYRTEATLADGKVVRRSCAHTPSGVRTLSSPEISFLDPIAARDHLAQIKPAIAPDPPPAPLPPPVVAAAPSVPKVAPPPPSGDPLLDHGMDESLALQPFDESMLKGEES